MPETNNRLTEVETSTDGIHYNRDAVYSYYKHGPLSRQVLGDGVQGLDFLYTLQGWIKGVNSPMLYKVTDPGKDGTDLSYAKDVFGYALGYYEGDYSAIGEYTATPVISPLPGGGTGSFNNPASPPLNSGKSLYNGNIRHMMQALDHLALHADTTLGFTYQYDQLNRLVGMDAWTGIDPYTQNWTSTGALPDYRERVTYDAMGNIQTYFRNGTTMNSNLLEMDDMTYNYYPGTNRLQRVLDQVSPTNYSGQIDIDDQSMVNNIPITNNYEYDASGNLTDDVSEGLEIFWNLQGKVDSIYKTNELTGIKYLYDAMGNRTGKRLHQTTGRTYTWYVRDASGNILSIFTEYPDDSKMYQSEYDIYGSARLGTINTNTLVYPRTVNQTSGNLPLGLKRYELSNHLGNVLSTISDLKLADDSDGDDYTDLYEAIVINQQSYYPFGMLMPEMQYSLNSNESGRFGFNGKENDDEVKGKGALQDYGMRHYDPRLGRFLSEDPLSQSFPYYTPYQFSGNKPIVAIDLDGLEDVWIHQYQFNDGTSRDITLFSFEEGAESSREAMALALNIDLSMLPEGGTLLTVSDENREIIRFEYQPGFITIVDTRSPLEKFGEFLQQTLPKAQSYDNENKLFIKEGRSNGPFISTELFAKTSYQKGLIKNTSKASIEDCGNESFDTKFINTTEISLNSNFSSNLRSKSQVGMKFNLSDNSEGFKTHLSIPFAGFGYLKFSAGSAGLESFEIGATSNPSKTMQLELTERINTIDTN